MPRPREWGSGTATTLPETPCEPGSFPYAATHDHDRRGGRRTVGRGGEATCAADRRRRGGSRPRRGVGVVRASRLRVPSAVYERAPGHPVVLAPAVRVPRPEPRRGAPAAVEP